MSDAIRLRNDHIVYILGAGYSAARGLPLIADFLNRMRDAAIWCEQSGRNGEAVAIQEVLKFRLSAAAAAYRIPIDLENIEELFSLASAADHRITNSVKVSIAATIAYCLSKYGAPQLLFSNSTTSAADMRRFARPQDNVGGSTGLLIPLYDAFAMRLLDAMHPGRSSIITFNYDNLVERSIEALGGTYHYGVVGRHQVPGKIPYDKEHGIAILKLHGSVNWAYPGKPGRNFTIFDNYDEVLENQLVPQIVPPTWNKTIADRLAEVWAASIERLSTATKIVVIGFSMPKTDQHFKYLLAAGLKENFSLREIIFVDPSDAVKGRSPEVLTEREISTGRVSFVKKHLHELLGSLVNPVLRQYSYQEIERPY